MNTLTQNKKRRLIEWSLLPAVMALAWPTMLEQLLQTAVQYIDTAMVGSLGTSATAAVGSTSTVNWLICGSISALGIGFLSYIARAIGSGDKSQVKRIVAQAVITTLIVGIASTVLVTSLSGIIPVLMQVDDSILELSSTYLLIIYLPMLPRTASLIFGTLLRAAGDTKTPMRVGLLVNLVNIVFNFFFIFPTRQITVFSFTFTVFGTGWGVIGAAIASAISFLVGGIIMTVALMRHPLLSPKGQKLKIDRSILIPCLKVSVPNMFQRFGTSLGYVFFASMINSLGDISTAAHTIANTVESAFYVPGSGMQTASATLAGNALGAKDNKLMKNYTAILLIIEASLMIISGGLLFALAPYAMKLFTKDAEVIMLGATVLRMVSLSEPLFGMAMVIEGMMQGVGSTQVPLIFNILCMWGIRIVGTLICIRQFGLGLTAAWACMIAHNVILFTLLMIRFLRKRWNPLFKREDAGDAGDACHFLERK